MQLHWRKWTHLRHTSWIRRCQAWETSAMRPFPKTFLNRNPTFKALWRSWKRNTFLTRRGLRTHSLIRLPVLRLRARIVPLISLPCCQSKSLWLRTSYVMLKRYSGGGTQRRWPGKHSKTWCIVPWMSLKRRKWGCGVDKPLRML